MAFAPEVFEVTYDGTLLVLAECPPETMRESVEEAVRSCPRQAIPIEDLQLHVSAQSWAVSSIQGSDGALLPGKMLSMYVTAK
jgi:ferredoxin